MVTDQIGLHSVLLPLFIKRSHLNMITETCKRKKKQNPRHFAKNAVKAIAHVLKRCIKPCA